MKKLIYITLAVLTLAACSNEDDFNKSSNQKEIGFKTSINANTRANSGFCQINKPNEIQVWSCVPNESGFKPYFENETYEFHDGVGLYRAKSQNYRYWTGSDIYFFAYSADREDNGNSKNISNIGWTSDGSVLECDYTNPMEPQNQYDFIYACSGKYSSNGWGTASGFYYASLYFRHALSQIEFKAKTTSGELYVEIVEVKLTNVRTNGHYTFPTRTGGSYITHNASSEQNVYQDDRGVWSNVKGTGNCIATFEPIGFVMSDGAVSLTELDTEKFGEGQNVNGTNTDDQKEFNNNTMYMIPQDAFKTSNIVVKAKIWEMADPSKGHQATDTQIFPDPASSSDYAEISFGIPNNWVEGKRHVYTLIFRKPNRLSFSVNVDDYDISSNEVVTY